MDDADNWSECALIDGAMECAPVPAECGNGIMEVDDGEECECIGKFTACAHCTGCKLDDGKECSADTFDKINGECCGEDGMLVAYKTPCAAGMGFCARGECVLPDTCNEPPESWANQFNIRDVCSVNENGCTVGCIINTGSCYVFDGWTAGGRQFNWLQDGAACMYSNGGWSTCFEGACRAVAAPTNSPTPPPTPPHITTSTTMHTTNLTPAPCDTDAINHDAVVADLFEDATVTCSNFALAFCTNGFIAFACPRTCNNLEGTTACYSAADYEVDQVGILFDQFLYGDRFRQRFVSVGLSLLDPTLTSADLKSPYALPNSNVRFLCLLRLLPFM
jgi:hypothetical protein